MGRFVGIVSAFLLGACASGVAPDELDTGVGASGRLSDPDSDPGTGGSTAGSTSGVSPTSTDSAASWTGTAGSTSGPGEAGDGIHYCGNGLIDLHSDEECDGAQLAQQTCASLNMVRGELACGSNCKFDTSGCIPCGNHQVDGPGEECDGSDLGKVRSCAELEGGSELGTLRCTEACKYDRQLCSQIPTTAACNSLEHEIVEGEGASSVIKIAAPQGQPDQKLVALRIEIELEHTQIDELLIRLDPEVGEELLLFEQQRGTECKGDDMHVILRDGAPTKVDNACRSLEQPAVSGEHRAVDLLLPALSAGGIAGTWYLIINDRATPDGNAGVLKRWCMHYATVDLQ